MIHQKAKVVTWDSLSTRFTSETSVNFNALSVAQRMILTTDGTLTNVLEAYYLEPIQIIKLQEEPLCIIGENPLAISPEHEIIDRITLLQTQQSQQNCLYAESIIIKTHLQTQFTEGLASSNKPIGKLWNEYKIETFKETLYRFVEPAAHLANYFGVKPETLLIGRTYQVISQKQLIMLITEKFPETFYR